MASVRIPSRITGICVISYPSLFTARAQDAQAGDKTPREAKFEATLVAVPEQGAGEWLRAFKADALQLLMGQYGNDQALIEAKIAAGEIHWPFRKVTDQPGYPAGGTILKAATKYRPDVVSRFAAPGTTEAARITDPDKVYPGMWVRASISPFLFGYKQSMGKKGVTWNLHNVQICDDLPLPPRLDNRKRAEDEFDALPAQTVDIPGANTTAARPSVAGSLLD